MVVGGRVGYAATLASVGGRSGVYSVTGQGGTGGQTHTATEELTPAGTATVLAGKGECIHNIVLLQALIN